jgi:hypothetical protein
MTPLTIIYHVGVGAGERSGDACVALGRGFTPYPSFAGPEGRRKRPHPTPPRSRPYAVGRPSRMILIVKFNWKHEYFNTSIEGQLVNDAVRLPLRSQMI